MKKILLISLLVLLGIGIFFYPNAANYFSDKNASKEISNFSRSVSQVDEKIIADEIKAAQDYNKQLTGEGIRDPFIPGSGIVMGADYKNLLNINNGMMGYITIPKIGVNLPIYHGSGDVTLQKGVGHLEGTALPVGGKSAHTVLTGHSALTNAKMFTDLTEIKKGDTFYIHIYNEVLAYQVDQVKVVLPSNTEDLMPVLDKDYVTLITCTPYGINSHRLLVRGGRIPYTPGAEKKAEAAEKTSWWTDDNRRLAVYASSTAAIMLALILTAVWRRKNSVIRPVSSGVYGNGTPSDVKENTDIAKMDIDEILKMMDEFLNRKDDRK